MIKRFLFGAALGLALIGGGCAKTPSTPPAADEKSAVTSGVTPTAQAPEPPVTAEVAAPSPSPFPRQPAPPPPPVPKTHAVSIKDFKFNLATLTVNVGDTVTWTQEDGAPHTVTSDSGAELDSPLLSKGQTFSHTFTTKGSFAYHCTPHPWMKAAVIVE